MKNNNTTNNNMKKFIRLFSFAVMTTTLIGCTSYPDYSSSSTSYGISAGPLGPSFYQHKTYQPPVYQAPVIVNQPNNYNNRPVQYNYSVVPCPPRVRQYSVYHVSGNTVHNVTDMRPQAQIRGHAPTFYCVP